MCKMNVDSYKVVLIDMSIRQFPVHGMHAVPEPASVHFPVSIWLWLAHERTQTPQVRYWSRSISAPIGTLWQVLLELTHASLLVLPAGAKFPLVYVSPTELSPEVLHMSVVSRTGIFYTGFHRSRTIVECRRVHFSLSCNLNLTSQENKGTIDQAMCESVQRLTIKAQLACGWSSRAHRR